LPQRRLLLNFPDLDPDAIPETCSLDVAARGDHTHEEVGALMNLSRERVRQIEQKALAKHPELRALARERFIR
jgi:DNA-directed RNA polymerase sigma subunit (sigma70/sigma32)